MISAYKMVLCPFRLSVVISQTNSPAKDFLANLTAVFVDVVSYLLFTVTLLSFAS